MRFGEEMALEAADLEFLGIGWTAERISDGRALACAALVEQWPGYAHAIMLAASLRGVQETRLVAAASRRVLAQSSFRRVDAYVRADFPAALRFAAWCGFSPVALLRAYGPDGADHMLFERLALPAEERIAA